MQIQHLTNALRVTMTQCCECCSFSIEVARFFKTCQLRIFYIFKIVCFYSVKHLMKPIQRHGSGGIRTHSHNSEDSMQVDCCLDPDCYSRPVAYNVTMRAKIGVVGTWRRHSECRQEECATHWTETTFKSDYHHCHFIDEWEFVISVNLKIKLFTIRYSVLL